MKILKILRRLFSRNKPLKVELKKEQELQWCSVWAAPNKVWKNDFAHNKPDNKFHPSLVMELHDDNTTCKIIPGTSQSYNKGKCVYPVNLKNKTYFLILKFITINNEDLIQFQRGWGAVKELNEDQKDGLYRQAWVCSNMKNDIRPKKNLKD